jgi:hypothetical protein
MFSEHNIFEKTLKVMKTLGLLLALLLSQVLFSQVGIGTTSPHQSSILHLNSTNSGLLVPRLTGTQKTAITSPATGLLIYQTDGAAGFWYFNGSVWLPFGNTYTFNNGLTLTGSNARLGGQLIQNTTLDVSNYDFTIRTTSPSSYPGQFILQGESREIMQTSFKDNYVEFGGWAYLGTSVDGTSLTTAGGETYTIDVVAGFKSDGAIGGSSIKMGSIEYIIDGISELYIDSNGFHPREDQTSSFGNTLGSSTKRWGAIYSNNGVIQTSDINFKKNVKPLKYGLNEILRINPISYNWKNNTLGKTQIPEDQIETKLGFSAQELLNIIPDVVQTYSWVPLDEDGNFKRIKNEKLGVNYSELIPVLVNAIQEQQKQIELLQDEIEKLKNK